MSQLFDDLSRIVGSGIPRRRMLKLIGFAFAGGAMPALWPTRAAAFEPCAQSFDVTITMETTTDCFECTSDYMNTLCQTRCNNAKPQAIEKAQTHCPTTCPQIVEESWKCEGHKNAEANLVCWMTLTANCRCFPPDSTKKCCGIINGVPQYCIYGTQKCCGTFCVPINQTCPNNPG